jgi:hypothetical protein
MDPILDISPGAYTGSTAPPKGASGLTPQRATLGEMTFGSPPLTRLGHLVWSFGGGGRLVQSLSTSRGLQGICAELAVAPSAISGGITVLLATSGTPARLTMTPGARAGRANLSVVIGSASASRSLRAELTAKDAVELGRWATLAFACANDGLSLFVDGQLVAFTRTKGTLSTASSLSVSLGVDADARTGRLVGLFAGARIWSETPEKYAARLPGEEVVGLYAPLVSATPLAAASGLTQTATSPPTSFFGAVPGASTKVYPWRFTATAGALPLQTSAVLSKMSQFTVEALIRPSGISGQRSNLCEAKVTPFSFALRPGVKAGFLSLSLSVNLSHSSGGRGVTEWLRVTAEDAVALNAWSAVAGSFTGSALHLFVNGALVGSLSPQSPVLAWLDAPGDPTLWVGTWVDGARDRFVGELAALRVLAELPARYAALVPKPGVLVELFAPQPPANVSAQPAGGTGLVASAATPYPSQSAFFGALPGADLKAYAWSVGGAARLAPPLAGPVPTAFGVELLCCVSSVPAAGLVLARIGAWGATARLIPSDLGGYADLEVTLSLGVTLNGRSLQLNEGARAARALRLGAWHTVGLTFNGAALDLFIDGVRRARGAISAPTLAGDGGAATLTLAEGGELRLGGLRVWDEVPERYAALPEPPPFQAIRTLRAEPALLRASVQRRLSQQSLPPEEVVWSEGDEAVTLSLKGLQVAALKGYIVVDVPMRAPLDTTRQGALRAAFRVGEDAAGATARMDLSRSAQGGLAARWAEALELAIYEGLLDTLEPLSLRLVNEDPLVRPLTALGLYADDAGLHVQMLVQEAR